MRLIRAAAAAALALVPLLVPAAALAEENLVTEHALPSGWSVTRDDVDSFAATGAYGDLADLDVDWVGESGVYAYLRHPDDPLVVNGVYEFYTSFEDFAARSDDEMVFVNDGFVDVPGSDEPQETGHEEPYTWTGAQQTTLGGVDAWSNVGTWQNASGYPWTQVQHVYWIPLDGAGIMVRGDVWAMGGDLSPSTPDTMLNDLEAALASLRFNVSGSTAAAAPPVVPGADTGEDEPWRTVTGGAASVAAAGVALAAARARGRTKRGEEEPPPDQPVGHVLQLSTNRVTVSDAHGAPLTAQAYDVFPNGAVRPSSSAVIRLGLPAGVVAQPSTATGALTTTVSQIGEVALGSTITVEARAPMGATTSSVAVAVAGISRIVARLEPAAPLHMGGRATLAATVELLGADAEDPTLDRAAVQRSLTFETSSEWADLSVPTPWGDGAAVAVVVGQPDPTRHQTPPESVPVRVTAYVREKRLTETVQVELAAPPEIDARPDTVTLAAESGASAEVSVWISNSTGTAWHFDTEWREGSRLLATPEIVATGSATATLTLTESAEDLDPGRRQTSATLVVVATADGFETLKREITVIVEREGLFVSRTNVDPSTNAFLVRADGSAVPTEFDLRVYVRDPATDEIVPDIALAQQVEFEPGGEETSVGHAGLRAGGFQVTPAGVRPGNNPSAIFRIHLPNTLPTGSDLVTASLRATVPGYGESAFTAGVPLRLRGVDMEPFSAEWERELQGCRLVIDEFVPLEYRENLRALLNERSLTMGAEGLFVMREQLWTFAHNQIVKERHEHLDEAWWIEQIEGTFEWISWCGDIAMGVASGSYVGVIGMSALGMLKPLLVSAMTTWVNGGSLEDWLSGQATALVGIAEGALTDPDVLMKLTGEKKALAWALFIAYYFAKELYNDPQLSVTNAMKRVGAQLRDEGLVRFLQYIVGMKGVSRKPTADAPTAKPDGPAAKPDGPPPPPPRPRADAPAAKPDGPAAKPDGPAARPDAPAAKPDGPAAKPDAPAAKPEPNAPAAKPDVPAAKPDGSDSKPDAPTAKPDAPAAKPDAPPAKPEGDVPPPEVPPVRDGSPRGRAESMARQLAAETADGGKVSKGTVERILRDPDAMRELKKARPDLWKEFHETRQQIYDGHDRRLVEWIEGNVPEARGRRVEIESFGTKDGVDRDYRAGYVVTDAQGNRRFIELKKEAWAQKSMEIFAEETGGPADGQGARDWAKEHQQLATDMYHGEASVDMADQATVWNEATRSWEKTQVTPNVIMVENGHSTLLDPDGLGKTYETKVAESYYQGNVLDAYRQADKSLHTLECCREGYAMQGYGIKELPPKVQAGMDAIKDVQSGRLTPEQADARMRELDYTGGLPDFMERISGQFAAFKWVRKA